MVESQEESLNPRRIFASRFWGFNPHTHPVVTFGKAGDRDRLLRLSSPGDLMLFVGTQAHPTPVAERGRLLGLAEFGHFPVEAIDLIDPAALRLDEMPGGQYRWPKGLPMVRAWRFDRHRPSVTEALGKQLPMYATVGAVRLTPEQCLAVLSLPRSPAPLCPSPLLEQQAWAHGAARRGGKTTGPRPTSWTANVTHDLTTTAHTYVMQFGKHPVWKIGWAKDVAARCAELNTHIPGEIVADQWRPRYGHRWASGDDAYRMEQRLLSFLEGRRTEGERINCDEKEIITAWSRALSGR